MQLSDLVGQTIVAATNIDKYPGEGRLIQIVTATGTFLIRGGYGEGAYLCDERYIEYLKDLDD